MFYSTLLIFFRHTRIALFWKDTFIFKFSFFDQFSTNFRRTFDRCTFHELSFDVISTNGRVRRNVIFDDMSHSTKGFSTKSHGRVANMGFNTIRENKFSRKFPNLQYFQESTFFIEPRLMCYWSKTFFTEADHSQEHHCHLNPILMLL